MSFLIKNSNGVIATATNPLKVDGDTGVGIRYNGSTDYTSISSVPATINHLSAFSICMVVKLSVPSISGAGVFHINQTVNFANGITIRLLTDGRIAFLIRNDNDNLIQCLSTTSVITGNVDTLIFTKKAGANSVTELAIYLNGIKLGCTLSDKGSISDTTFSGIEIGRYALGQYVPNDMYDFILFDKELTDTEIGILHSSNLVKIPSTAASNVQLHYPVIVRSGATLYDKSANGYNGVLTGFSSTALGGGSRVDKYGNIITQN